MRQPIAFALVGIALGQVFAQDRFLPARILQTTLPLQPQMVLGGGEVLFEVTVGETGVVREIITLRATPPFTKLAAEAVRTWRFAPASQQVDVKLQPRAIETRVLVAGVFRPPTLYNGPAPGERPKDVGMASSQIPFPTKTTVPMYPAQALFDGIVVVEAAVAATGMVSDAKVVATGAGFERAALDAARQWRFRPAVRDGAPIKTYAYLIFGFRQPIMSRVFQP